MSRKKFRTMLLSSKTYGIFFTPNAIPVPVLIADTIYGIHVCPVPVQVILDILLTVLKIRKNYVLRSRSRLQENKSRKGIRLIQDGFDTLVLLTFPLI